MRDVIRNIKQSARRISASRESKKAAKGKLIFLLILFLAAVALLWHAYTFYTASPYFTVKKVLLIGDKSGSSVDYTAISRMVVGKNIFKVNLNAVGSHMLNDYRELRNLRIRRAFPDSIVVIADLRKPVAQLFQERYYPIDRECVVLSGAKDVPDNRLPVISGINADISKAVGSKIDSECLKQALILFEFIKKSGILNSHILCEINAGNMKGIYFVLDDGIEVRIGYEDYADRLGNLNEILSDPKIWPSDIGYIDLRFGEPVIGPKWRR